MLSLQVFHLLSQVSLEREDPRSSESLFPEFLAKAESFSLRARGPRSSEQVCSMCFFWKLWNSVSFTSLIRFRRSLDRTEGKNMFYHVVMRNIIFDRLLPDFSGKPFI